MGQFLPVLHQGVVGGLAWLNQPQLLLGAMVLPHPEPNLAGWGWVAASTDCSGGFLLTSVAFSCMQEWGTPEVPGHFGLAAPHLGSNESSEFNEAARL